MKVRIVAPYVWEVHIGAMPPVAKRVFHVERVLAGGEAYAVGVVGAWTIATAAVLRWSPAAQVDVVTQRCRFDRASTMAPAVNGRDLWATAIEVDLRMSRARSVLPVVIIALPVQRMDWRTFMCETEKI